LGDFDVYIGSIGRGASVKGAVLQIVYNPCDNIEDCEGRIDFM
jgi:hypothetical protein